MSLIKLTQSGYDPDGMPTRVLSIQQPWAFCIFNLPESIRKDVENRSRNMHILWTERYIWIHACRSTLTAYENAKRIVAPLMLPALRSLKTGAIIGYVSFREPYTPGNCKSVWADPKSMAYPITHAKLITEPVETTGQLGVWKVKKGIEPALRAQWELELAKRNKR